MKLILLNQMLPIAHRHKLPLQPGINSVLDGRAGKVLGYSSQAAGFILLSQPVIMVLLSPLADLFIHTYIINISRDL